MPDEDGLRMATNGPTGTEADMPRDSRPHPVSLPTAQAVIGGLKPALQYPRITPRIAVPRRKRPLPRMPDQPVFHRIDPAIPHMLPRNPCHPGCDAPKTASARPVVPPPNLRFERSSPVGRASPNSLRPPARRIVALRRVGLNPDLRNSRVNRALIAAIRTNNPHPPPATSTRNAYGPATPPTHQSGTAASPASPPPPCRNTSTCRTNVSAPRSTRLTVKKTQAPGTLGRIYADMPASCPSVVNTSLPVSCLQKRVF